MTFEEFKKTCHHTRLYLKVPALNLSLNKVDNFMTKGKYDFEKEENLLKRIYTKNADKLSRL